MIAVIKSISQGTRALARWFGPLRTLEVRITPECADCTVTTRLQRITPPCYRCQGSGLTCLNNDPTIRPTERTEHTLRSVPGKKGNGKQLL
jgi:hypothetical protein